MDEADAGLVGLDNRLRNLALGLELLKTVFYSRQLILQSRSVFWVAGCNLRSQVFALLLKLKFLWIARQGGTAFAIFKRPARAFHQPLFCQHAGLQSSDCSIDAGILLLAAKVEKEKDHGGNDNNGNSHQSANPQRPASLVDRCHHLPGSVSIFLGKAELFSKLVRSRFIAQLRTNPRQQFM